jgi:hypothetical protein
MFSGSKCRVRTSLEYSVDIIGHSEPYCTIPSNKHNNIPGRKKLKLIAQNKYLNPH